MLKHTKNTSKSNGELHWQMNQSPKRGRQKTKTATLLVDGKQALTYGNHKNSIKERKKTYTNSEACALMHASTHNIHLIHTSYSSTSDIGWKDYGEKPNCMTKCILNLYK